MLRLMQHLMEQAQRSGAERASMAVLDHDVEVIDGGEVDDMAVEDHGVDSAVVEAHLMELEDVDVGATDYIKAVTVPNFRKVGCNDAVKRAALPVPSLCLLLIFNQTGLGGHGRGV